MIGVEKVEQPKRKKYLGKWTGSFTAMKCKSQRKTGLKTKDELQSAVKSANENYTGIFN